MLRLITLLAFSTLTLATASQNPYPTQPDDALTPGTTCQNPDEYRYPEQIAYCNRNVNSEKKKEVIVEYDQQLGYQVEQMNRADFKIDHFVPLCMGGGNDSQNLWPQHKSVYEITDPIEEKLCELLSKGTLKQADAIDLMKHVKHHLDEAPELTRRLDAQLAQ